MPRICNFYTTNQLQKAFLGNSRKEALKKGLSTYNPDYNPKLLRRVEKNGYKKNKEIVDKQFYWHRDIVLIRSYYPLNCSDRFHYELYTSKFTKFDLGYSIPAETPTPKKLEKELKEANKIKKSQMLFLFDFLWDKLKVGDKHPENKTGGQGIWKFDIPGEKYENIIHTNILSTHKLDNLQMLLNQKL